jgi:hypothetical protein
MVKRMMRCRFIVGDVVAVYARDAYRQVIVAVIGAPASDAILAEAGGQDLPNIHV